MDRASGSGVFARDPDALLDLIELEVSENLLKEEKNKAVCNVCYDALVRNGHLGAASASDISQDEMVTAKAILGRAEKALPAPVMAEVRKDIAAAEKAAESRSAWRIEGTLREFPKFPPVNVWFDYPIHRIDMVGVLSDVSAEGDLPTWQMMNEKRKKQAKQQNDDNKIKFENAVTMANMGEAPTVAMLVDYLDVSERTVRRWVTKYGYTVDKNTMSVLKNDGGGTSD